MPVLKDNRKHNHTKIIIETGAFGAGLTAQYSFELALIDSVCLINLLFRRQIGAGLTTLNSPNVGLLEGVLTC